MRWAAAVALCALLWGGIVVAQEEEPESRSEQIIPGTFGDAADAFREGGSELGQGFRGVGRGIKGTFTGRRSAQDYHQGRNIGTGFRDIGRGIAGEARAVGRQIKRSVKGEGED